MSILLLEHEKRIPGTEKTWNKTQREDNACINDWDENEKCLTDPILTADCLHDKVIQTKNRYCYNYDSLAKVVASKAADPLTREPVNKVLIDYVHKYGDQALQKAIDDNDEKTLVGLLDAGANLNGMDIPKEMRDSILTSMESAAGFNTLLTKYPELAREMQTVSIFPQTGPSRPILVIFTDHTPLAGKHNFQELLPRW